MLPNLPTDNLYKFITMLGIAICFGSTFLLLSAQAKMDIDTQQFLKETEDLSVAAYNYISDLNKIKLFITKHGDSKKDAPIEVQEKIEQMLSQNDPLELQANQLLQKSYHPLMLYQQRQKHFSSIKLISFFGIFFGLSMASVGIWLWYFKHQRLMDSGNL